MLWCSSVGLDFSLETSFFVRVLRARWETSSGHRPTGRAGVFFLWSDGFLYREVKVPQDELIIVSHWTCTNISDMWLVFFAGPDDLWQTCFLSVCHFSCCCLTKCWLCTVVNTPKVRHVVVLPLLHILSWVLKGVHHQGSALGLISLKKTLVIHKNAFFG